MPVTFTSSTYIDGNNTTRYRAITGNGISGDPDYTGVALHLESLKPHPDFSSSNNEYKVVLPAPSNKFSNTTISLTTTLSEVMRLDVSRARMIHMRLAAGSTPLADFTIDVASHPDFELWDTLVNGDSQYTTGTGENSGNPLILVRKAGANPRSLPANTPTWLVLNVEPYSRIRFNAKVASGTGLMSIIGTMKTY